MTDKTSANRLYVLSGQIIRLEFETHCRVENERISKKQAHIQICVIGSNRAIDEIDAVCASLTSHEINYGATPELILELNDAAKFMVNKAIGEKARHAWRRLEILLPYEGSVPDEKLRHSYTVADRLGKSIDRLIQILENFGGVPAKIR